MSSQENLENQKVEDQDVTVEVITKETRILKIKKLVRIRKSVSTSENNELLQGKTMQVYWYLLEQGPASIREIHEALNFSSSGIAYYQIKKLIASGTVSKDEENGKYVINEKVKAGILNFYLALGDLLIPRFSIYLVFFLFGFLIYFMSFLILGDKFITSLGAILFLFFLIIGTFAFTYESIKTWGLKPGK